MINAILSLYSWLPTPIFALISFVIIFFIVWSLVKIIKAIWDLIPFA